MSTAAWVFLWALGSPAFAGELRAPVLELLGGYEETPTEAQLRALGAGVDAELLAVAQDPSVPATRRARAVSALQHFPSEPAAAWLKSELASPSAESILRRKAAWTLAALQGDAALPALGAALADPDPQLRIAAAGALGHLSTTGADQLLQARLPAEPDVAVRAVIAKEIAR